MSDAVISEIFESVQGELPLMGYRMLFVRMAGCNRRCPLCDEPHALANSGPAVKTMTVDEILSEVEKHPAADWIWFTGGEPTLQAKFVNDVITRIRTSNPRKKIGMDTNGDLIKSRMRLDVWCVLVDLDCLIISPKFNNGGVENDGGGWYKRFDDLTSDIVKWKLREFTHIRLLVTDAVAEFVAKEKDPFKFADGWKNPVILSPAEGSGVTYKSLWTLMPKGSRVSFQAHKIFKFK